MILLPCTAHAGLNHLFSTYGVLPSDIARSGAASAGDADPSAAYYNPAALADLPDNRIVLGWLYGSPDFSGGLDGREKNFSVANRVVLVGLGLDIGRAFPKKYPIGFGLDVSLDDNGRSLMSFDDRRVAEGNFISYGVRTICLASGAGVRIIRGLNLGGGVLLGLSARAHLRTETDVIGETSESQVYMTAKPILAPIGSFQTTFPRVKFGGVYRGKLVGKVGPVDADALVDVGDSKLTSIPLTLYFKDGYVPQQAAAAVEIMPGSAFSASFQGEWKNWSGFDDEIRRGDDARADSGISTHDIWIPRVGVMGRPTDNFSIRGGAAFEPSPFSKIGSGTNIVLDNDRFRVSAGLGYTWPKLSFLSCPLSVDAAFLWLRLVPRDGAASDGRTFHSEGNLFGGAASVSLGF